MPKEPEANHFQRFFSDTEPSKTKTVMKPENQQVLTSRLRDKVFTTMEPMSEPITCAIKIYQTCCGFLKDLGSCFRILRASGHPYCPERCWLLGIGTVPRHPAGAWWLGYKKSPAMDDKAKARKSYTTPLLIESGVRRQPKIRSQKRYHCSETLATWV